MFSSRYASRIRQLHASDNIIGQRIHIGRDSDAGVAQAS